MQLRLNIYGDAGIVKKTSKDVGLIRINKGNIFSNWIRYLRKMYPYQLKIYVFEDLTNCTSMLLTWFYTIF